MINYTIRVTQRTALGLDQGATTDIHAVRWVSNDVLELVENVSEHFDGIPSNAYETVGYITIRHPRIMAGSHNDNLSDFYSIAMDKLKEKGHVTENDYGVCFWVG